VPDNPWREIPAAADLLATARATLLAEVVPLLPAEKRLPALMAANAIGIALRDAAADEGAEQALAARLAALLGREGTAEALLGDLAAGIRAGNHDPGTPKHAATAAFLTDLARHRAAISNPKALASS
jgi:hypothetical protein